MKLNRIFNFKNPYFLINLFFANTLLLIFCKIILIVEGFTDEFIYSIAYIGVYLVFFIYLFILILEFFKLVKRLLKRK